MTKTHNPYTLLGWLAMIAVPVSPAMFFGWKAYAALLILTGSDWLAVPGGILTALGLELVGIFAGHTAIEMYRRHDPRWKLAALIMMVYVIIGTTELWSNPIGRVTFLIAALVYLLVGLRHDLEVVLLAEASETEKQQAEAKAEKEQKEAWEMEQAAKDREVERQLRLQTEADKTAIQLAKIQAKTTPLNEPKLYPDMVTVLDTSKTDWRKLSNAERRQIALLAPEQIVNQFGVSDKTARRWLERASKMSPQMSFNGTH